MFSVPFEEVASEDVWVTLKKLLESGMDQRKQVAKEYIHVFDLDTQEAREYFYGLYLYGYLAGIYLFKVNYGNTRTICKICSKLAIKTPERRQ